MRLEYLLQAKALDRLYSSILDTNRPWLFGRTLATYIEYVNMEIDRSFAGAFGQSFTEKR